MARSESAIIYGRNPIASALASHHVKKLYVANHLRGDDLVSAARKDGVEVAFVDDSQLLHLSENPAHQGFVATVVPYGTNSLEDLIQGCRGKRYPLMVILDGLEDPHNLGAILRSADAFGADGLIMKSRGEVPLTGTVAKVSTGAIDYVKVAVVSNLSQAIEKLKEAGFWIVASDGSATTSYCDVDYRSPIGLVIGSEGFGISPLLLKRSDFVVKIPMEGHVNSLNASVAAGIFLAEIRAKQL